MKSRVIEVEKPPMIKIDIGEKPVLVNQSKIRKNPDPWHDVMIPGLLNRDGVPVVPTPSEVEPGEPPGGTMSQPAPMTPGRRITGKKEAPGAANLIDRKPVNKSTCDASSTIK